MELRLYWMKHGEDILYYMQFLHPHFTHWNYHAKDTYSLSRTLLKNCIVDRCSSFPSGTAGLSSHELLNPGPSAMLRNSSYWSGSAKQVGVIGRDTSAGSEDNWLAILHKPERLHRTLWTPRMRFTRCSGPIALNSALERHSGSPSEKVKQRSRVQLLRRSTARSWIQ
jgi:hypothetical protein